VGGVFTGSALSALLTLSPDRNRRTAIAVFVLAGIGITLCQRKNELIYPLRARIEDRWQQGVCLQTTDATCGPASLATCLREIGIPSSERDLVEQAHTAKDGSLFADLARAARRRGARAVFHGNESASTISTPAIASVTRLESPHFVALVDRDGHRFVADPLDGLHPLTSGADYDWSGMFLSIQAKPVQ
jgi:hypothetical protein